jgi:hypothetical protein
MAKLREANGANNRESHLNNLNLIIPDEKSRNSCEEESIARKFAENFSIALQQCDALGECKFPWQYCSTENDE